MAQLTRWLMGSHMKKKIFLLSFKSLHERLLVFKVLTLQKKKKNPAMSIAPRKYCLAVKLNGSLKLDPLYTLGYGIMCISSYDARGKFEERESSVRVARGAADENPQNLNW